MAETSTPTSTPLTAHGINPSGAVHWNLDTDVLIDISLSKNEGVLSAHGALVTETGERTGRSPNDKFIVDEETTNSDVNWGKVNVSTDLATFERMRSQVVDFLSQQDALFVQDLACGAEPSEALSIRVITHNAWHSTFAQTCSFDPRWKNLLHTLPNLPCSTRLISKRTTPRSILSVLSLSTMLQERSLSVELAMQEKSRNPFSQS